MANQSTPGAAPPARPPSDWRQYWDYGPTGQFGITSFGHNAQAPPPLAPGQTTTQAQTLGDVANSAGKHMSGGLDQNHGMITQGSSGPAVPTSSGGGSWDDIINQIVAKLK